MLDVLPTELSLSIFSYLNIPCLLSLRLVSRQWDTLISENEPAIFHCAAYVHQFIKSEALSLEDELSAGHPGTPWQGSTDWKDFCRRSIQLRRNWEGKGRVAGRLLVPPGRDVHRIKVDERAELCITTHMYGGITVNHLFSGKLLWSLPLNYLRPQAHCEYENGYLVLDNFDGDKEVWRLATDVPHGEVCEKAPPSEAQHGMSEVVAERHQSHAPRGHFRPWALLSLPVPTLAYRLAFPTLLISGEGRAFVYDVCTGALLQTINIGSQDVNYVDVNEQYVFVCSPRVLRIFARKGGNLVLQIPSDASISRVFTVKDPSTIPGDPFVAPLPLIKVSTKGEYIGFRAAHVSRDGRDIVIMDIKHRIVLIRDFERIYRGGTKLQDAGVWLRLSRKEICSYLAFEHGRVCVSTVNGLYIFTVNPDPNASPPVKATSVRPYVQEVMDIHEVKCMQMTDRRVYFTWEDSRRRNIPLIEDDPTHLSPELPPPTNHSPPFDPILWPGDRVPPGLKMVVCCIDFSLMPE